MQALRRRAICAATAVLLLLELSACTTAGLPPSVAAGAPKSPRTVAPMAPKSSSTIVPGVPKSSITIKPSVPKQPRAGVRRPDHVVVVVLENKHRSSVMGSSQAPYLNKLAKQSANMTR